MDETTLMIQKVSKQLRTIKIMLTLFFVMIIGMLGVLAFIAFTVIMFTRDITHKVNDIQTKASDSLNVQNKLCANQTISRLLPDSSEVCQ